MVKLSKYFHNTVRDRYDIINQDIGPFKDENTDVNKIYTILFLIYCKNHINYSNNTNNKL